MREWQKPLDEAKIAWLQEQFALAKANIEAVWGVYTPPWRERR